MAQGKSGEDQSHTVILMPSGRRDQVPEGKSLLEAADAMGVQIESICGGKQTCGKCHVIVEEGLFEKHKIDSRADHLSPKKDEEKHLLKKMDLDGQRLACAAYPLGDLLITVPEESRAQKQIIRKSATERVINVNPAVWQY